VAGSYEIETRTNAIEAEARALLVRIDAAGGTLAAIESGLIQREIQESAFRAQRAIETGAATVVGVTKFQSEEGTPVPTFRIDPAAEATQRQRLRAVRASRNEEYWRNGIEAVRQAALGDANLVPPIIAAVAARATVGEISDTLRAVFGEHHETSGL
jgi:methylmalonyl-CoA mutase N-terminal domain/subunit